MLKGLSSLLTPELLYVLAQMGHGDEIALVDRNFPATARARRVVRLDGCDLDAAARVVLSVLPLDTFVDEPLTGMHPVDAAGEIPDVQRGVIGIAEEAEARPIALRPIDRFAFYARAESAFAVVTTTESRPYGCVLLTKGVIND
ncbi:MAG TPA: RbsD/FucU domain-containing protein [Streptosporangiaceae bacterium]|jgi:L-fucose mutarotase